MISYPHDRNSIIRNARLRIFKIYLKKQNTTNVVLYVLDVEILVEYTDNNGDKIVYATV